MIDGNKSDLAWCIGFIEEVNKVNPIFDTVIRRLNRILKEEDKR